jgi:hypothetical protein
VAPGISPLDEALGLTTSQLSPGVLRRLVHLGADLPFAQAAARLEELTGVVTSPTTVRRLTEGVGATAVALEDVEVDRLEREAPAPPAAPERLVLGADGAMVPLVGGEWAEVKLLSIGVPTGVPTGQAGGAPHRQTGSLAARSYCARLSDAETFGRHALAEVHRRGVEAATAVAAVQDGAPWLQGFVDLHRPDAVRILDWPHAAQHLSGVAETVFGGQTPRAARVAERLRRWLWAEGPDRVLAVLAGWERACPSRSELATAVAYFRDRRAQLAYPAFRAAGWPVGSGATESGHKQVMQARMKRAGMRWARPHVNSMLALRVLECNGRWAAECPGLLRQHGQRTRAARRRQHRHGPPAPQPTSPAAAPSPPPVAAPPARLPIRPSPFRHPWRAYGTRLSAKL